METRFWVVESYESTRSSLVRYASLNSVHFIISLISILYFFLLFAAVLLVKNIIFFNFKSALFLYNNLLRT